MKNRPFSMKNQPFSDERLREAAQIYLETRSLKATALRLGLPPNFFYEYFSAAPEKEDSFNNLVEDISNRSARRLAAASVPLAIKVLGESLSGGVLEDGRIGVGAARAVIDFWLKISKGDSEKEDELEELFKSIRKGRK